jgi:hypothetical protein
LVLFALLADFVRFKINLLNPVGWLAANSTIPQRLSALLPHALSARFADTYCHKNLA